MPTLKLTKLGYKVVTKNYRSLVKIKDREKVHKSRGKILTYQVGTTVTSPNGVCECEWDCCAGISAYVSLEDAVDTWLHSPDGARIVIVRAKRWWKGEKELNVTLKMRTAQVKVVREMSRKMIDTSLRVPHYWL